MVKTIAVLTDFSAGSVHATRYAMHMAQKMKAKILLFSLSPVTANRRLKFAGIDEWLQDESAPDNLLVGFCNAMNLLQQQSTFPTAYRPEISYNNESSEMEDIMTSIGNDDQVVLLVTPLLGCEDLSSFIAGDTCSKIIDWASVPVLVIPAGAAIKNYEKIAFVTTLHQQDINAIAWLGELIEVFAADLMVAHLNEDPGDCLKAAAEQTLSRGLYEKTNYGRIYFRSIPDLHPQKDWEWLKANKKTDLLALVQRSREQMTAFFKRGQNIQRTLHLHIPVMILPKMP
jgi:hypothetical protein